MSTSEHLTPNGGSTVHALEWLAEVQQQSLVLPSGLEVGMRVLPLRIFFETELIPVIDIDAVLQEQPDLADRPEVVADLAGERAGDRRYIAQQKYLLARSIVWLRAPGGEREYVTLTARDTDRFDDADFTALMQVVMRRMPLGDTEPSPTSDGSPDPEPVRSTDSSVDTTGSTPEPSSVTTT